MRWIEAARALASEKDFQRHVEAYEAAYRKRAALPLEPLWYPEMDARTPHLREVLHERGLPTYEALHRWSVSHRPDFWAYTIFDRLKVPFYEKPQALVRFPLGTVTQPSWLEGARLNILEAIFRWPPDAEALVEHQEDGRVMRLTYGELQAQVMAAAGAFLSQGLEPGQTVAICLPMRWEAAVLYLGALWAGLSVATIPDSLSGEEIATRLKIVRPQLLFIQDFIYREGKAIPLYDRLSGEGLPRTFVLTGGQQLGVRLRNQVFPFGQFWEAGEPLRQGYAARPTDVIGVLFSSGTTATPKAIPWTHLTAIKAAADGYYYHDLAPGDRLTWPTNLGWMMGPWLLFAGLVNGATVCLYNGAPTGADFCSFVEKADISVLGVVPSLVRRWIESSAWEGVNWQKIRLFSSTGEASNPWHMWRLMAKAGYKPVIEYCGGTEIGGGYITSTLLHPNAPSQFSAPALGLDFVILDEADQPASEGELFLMPPSIGLSQVLLNASHEEVYYQGTPEVGEGWVGASGAPIPKAIAGAAVRLRRHGDYMRRLENGYWVSGGRADDAMNLGGIKVSATEIERVVAQVAGVSEVAAIAVPPPEGGPEQLVLYLVLQPQAPREKAYWLQQTNTAVRERLSPLFHVRDVVVVEELPRTASNKVMRRLLRQAYVASASQAT